MPARATSPLCWSHSPLYLDPTTDRPTRPLGAAKHTPDVSEPRTRESVPFEVIDTHPPSYMRHALPRHPATSALVPRPFALERPHFPQHRRLLRISPVDHRDCKSDRRNIVDEPLFCRFAPRLLDAPSCAPFAADLAAASQAKPPLRVQKK